MVKFIKTFLRFTVFSNCASKISIFQGIVCLLLYREKNTSILDDDLVDINVYKYTAKNPVLTENRTQRSIGDERNLLKFGMRKKPATINAAH